MPSAASSTARPAAAKPRRLGRGLSSLLGDATASASIPPKNPHKTHNLNSQQSGAGAASGAALDHAELRADVDRIRRLPLADIAPNPRQPRQSFDDDAIAQLAESIRQDGLLQPIVVRTAPQTADAPYLLVAGERRFRAARIAGLDPIPALVVNMPDRQAAEWALIENMQREDLNPMERAWGVRQLRDEFGVRQQDIADRLGLNRSTIANLLRLTDLDQDIQAMLAQSLLTLGHGKALLAAPPGAPRCELAQQAVKHAWSVRKLERLAAGLARRQTSAAPSHVPSSAPASPSLRAAARADLERRLSDALAADTTIHTSASGGQGHLRIAFTDLEHFDALLRKLGVAAAS